MPRYASAAYWDERYAATADTQAEWYLSYDQLRPHIERFLRRSDEFEVLIPGCGNSSLSEDLHADDIHNVTSIDISSVVVAQMGDRHADKPQLEFSVMDACDLSALPQDVFDLVIDKALMDALLCGEDSLARVSSLVSSMHRVLKPGGTYVVVSHGVPDTRIGYLQVEGLTWTVEHAAVPKPELEEFPDMGASESYHIYCCTKPAP